MRESVEKPSEGVTGKNMTFRISFKCSILVYFASLFWGLQVDAQVSNKPTWVDLYQSPEFEFPKEGSKWQDVTAGRHPKWIQNLLNDWLSWDPQDQLPRLTSNCLATDLQLQLQNSKSELQFNEIFKKFKILAIHIN